MHTAFKKFKICNNDIHKCTVQSVVAPVYKVKNYEHYGKDKSTGDVYKIRGFSQIARLIR